MTFNVEAFIKEKEFEDEFGPGLMVMAVADVRALVAQQVPAGHVVVPRDALECFMTTINAACQHLEGSVLYIKDQDVRASAAALAKHYHDRAAALQSALSLPASSGPEQPKPHDIVVRVIGSDDVGLMREIDTALRHAGYDRLGGGNGPDKTMYSQFVLPYRCPTCKDTKRVIAVGAVEDYLEDCPDCAKDRAEPMRRLSEQEAASLHEALKESVVFVDDPEGRAEPPRCQALPCNCHGKVATHQITYADGSVRPISEYCATQHLITGFKIEPLCHSPAPAAKEVMP